MVFGKKIDNVINEFENEFNVEYYGFNEYMNGTEKKQALTDDVNVAYISCEGKNIKVGKYMMANNKYRVDIEFNGELIKYKTQNELVEKMLDFLTK